MNIVDVFESFAADFESTLQDDDWSRLEKYFTDDATYLNIGDPDSQCNGRGAILSYLKTDISNFDRKFDSRTLMAITSPEVSGNRLLRRWRTTFSLKGTPDLIMEGEARYQFVGQFIQAIEEELTPKSVKNITEWMQAYGDKLQS